MPRTPLNHADEVTAIFQNPVSAAAGDGMLGLVYDGALRGRHLDLLMRRSGLVVMSTMAKHAAGPRMHPIGGWVHERAGADCQHVLAAVDGAVHEVVLDERGEQAYRRLERRQVKRARRAAGWSFSLGYDLHCHGVQHTVWVSPHATPADVARPEHVRAFPSGDADYEALRGVRSNSESFHAHAKRSLWSGRAMALGWRRGLVDMMAFALLANARAEHQFQAATAVRHLNARRSPGSGRRLAA